MNIIKSTIITVGAMLAVTGSNVMANDTISVLISNRSNEFFSVLEKSAVNRGEELGYNVRVYDGGNNASRQPSQVEDAIASGSKAIIINPLNEDATSFVLNEAVNRGIQVVTVDTTVQDVDLLSEIATDNEDGGKFAAQWLVKKSGVDPSQLGGIIHMKGLDGHTAHISRYKGFHDYLKSDSVDKAWNTLTQSGDTYIELTGSFSQDGAQSALESRLSALDPEATYAIYCENDVMAIGVINAIKNDPRFDLSNFKIIGFDGSSEGKNLVDEGKMDVTVVQDFEYIGSEAINVIHNYLQNQAMPESVTNAVEVVMYPTDQSPR